MTSESNALHLAQSAFEAVCKERDEARDQLNAMREMLTEAWECLNKCHRQLPDGDDTAWETLAKLKPFIKP